MPRMRAAGSRSTRPARARHQDASRLPRNVRRTRCIGSRRRRPHGVRAESGDRSREAGGVLGQDASSPPGQRTTARSMVLRSSRTLPGHGYLRRTSIAAPESDGRTSRSISRHAPVRNIRVRGSISPGRSRNGGISSVIPFSQRSVRNRLVAASCSRFRLVAAKKRTSTGRSRVDPRRVTFVPARAAA